jgi:cytochrome c oxidase subunit 2
MNDSILKRPPSRSMRSRWRRMGLVWRLIAVLVTASTATAAPGDPPMAGAGRAVLCESCHGVRGEGLPALNAPRLAGLQSWYLERQLQHFRHGIRGAQPTDTYGRQMQSMATQLGDDSGVEDVVAYLATLRPTQTARTIEGDATRGKDLFRACTACHGSAAQGSEDLHAPALKWANDWYVFRQLSNFRSGARGSDPRDIDGAAMRAIALSVPDEQGLRDLAVYVATLQ